MVRDRKFYTHFFSLALPIMLQNVVVISVNLLANIMIGGYGELAVSGVAAANQILFVPQMLTTSICDGIVVLSSQYWGQKRTEEMKSIIGVGVKLQFLLSAFFFVFIFFFPEFAASIITPDPEVIAESVKYLQIMAFSYFFSCLTSMLVASMRVVESVKIGFIINLSALAVSASLNYILIYGRLGAPRLGIRGAAFAILTSRVIEFSIAVCYVLFIDKKLRLKIRDFVSRDLSYLKDFVKIGVPIVLAGLVWALAQVCHGAILGRMGAQSLTANGIARNLSNLIYVGSQAMASVASVITGKTVGEGDTGKIKLYTRTIQVLFLMIGALSSLLLFASKGFMLSLYNISPDTYALTNSFLTVLCVTIFFSSYQMPCLTGIVRGGGDTKFVLYNDTINQWLIVIPSSALAAFVFNLPASIVFMFLCSDQVIKFFVAIVKVNRFRWIKILTR